MRDFFDEDELAESVSNLSLLLTGFKILIRYSGFGVFLALSIYDLSSSTFESSLLIESLDNLITLLTLPVFYTSR